MVSLQVVEAEEEVGGEEGLATEVSRIRDHQNKLLVSLRDI